VVSTLFSVIRPRNTNYYRTRSGCQIFGWVLSIALCGLLRSLSNEAHAICLSVPTRFERASWRRSEKAKGRSPLRANKFFCASLVAEEPIHNAQPSAAGERQHRRDGEYRRCFRLNMDYRGNDCRRPRPYRYGYQHGRRRIPSSSRDVRFGFSRSQVRRSESRSDASERSNQTPLPYFVGSFI
jgi:hypothetical protein